MLDRRRTYISSVMTAKKNGTSPDKRRKYDEAFKTEGPRLASESRSTRAAARQLGISPKLGINLNHRFTVAVEHQTDFAPRKMFTVVAGVAYPQQNEKLPQPTGYGSFSANQPAAKLAPPT